MSGFGSLLWRDLVLMFRQGGSLGAAASFMLAFVVMIPLAIGPDQATLSRLAPGLMWLALLLAVLLTTERMFQQDHEDGSLDLLATGRLPLELVCLAKAAAHWLSVSLPLSVVAAPVGILLNLDTPRILPVMLAMVTGSLALSLLASVAGAVTAGLRRGGLVVPLLVLPLYVPVLIFGIAASTGDMNPSGATPALLVLMAIALVSLVIQPWAAAAALRAYFR
jgi:heme exporter protein B